ncbi:hypothetical protein PTI45_02411 [Paenibacillus nuruki]|uniref:Uncharacterized protein n=1 Tax=Paenibacillus nuruki TaxID=1886670 RepID=A0A1E3L5G8_9BACL|nr:hypothetical protein [Paenibacillus nuruki]ODP28210.1 hypothetical protein PTI45_02411 [Paenibacillus nuruki]
MEVSPVILSAVISAAIAIITLIISTSITLRKNIHEERSYFEKSLKEKLENIYLNLNLDIDSRKVDEPLIKESNQELVHKYGYLLSPELLDEIKNLIHIEQNQEEYTALRSNVIKGFKKEFAMLQHLYDSHFESYRQKYTATNIMKVKNIVLKICITISLVIYLMVITLVAYEYFNSKPRMIENPILNAIVVFIMSITVFTTGLGIGKVVLKFIDWLDNRVGKTKRAYKFDDKVPTTGDYFCRACKKMNRKIKYTTFGYCEDHTAKQK